MKKAPPVIVLLGGPGSGKGTQGQVIADTLGLNHISTGVWFRKHISDKTPVGLVADRYISKGQLVPDDVATDLLKEVLETVDTEKGMILDGYPRSLPQAEALGAILEKRGDSLAAVLYLNVSDEEIINRLGGRLTCRQCQRTYHKIYSPPKDETVCPACGGELYQREDDNPDAVAQRLEVYHRMNGPIIDFYREKGVLVEINAEGLPDTVKNRVRKAARKIVS